MGSYTCAGYSRLGTGIAGERTGGTRQHTMQTAQSLEEQANMFLSVADATTEEGSFAASTVEVGNMFTCVEGLDMWAPPQACTELKVMTESSPGKLMRCVPKPTQKPFSLKKEGLLVTLNASANRAPFVKSV